MLKPFWREQPLTDDERVLLDELVEAHTKCSFRNNPSSIAMEAAASGSGSFLNGVAAACASTGGRHAPIGAVCDFLLRDDAIEAAKEMRRVPGFGYSFEDKGEFDGVMMLIRRIHPTLARKMQLLQDALSDVPANPSLYTAAAAIILGLPSPLADYLFIYSRLSAWGMIYMKAQPN